LSPPGRFLIDDIDLMAVIDAMRTAGRVPPDYQAQLIEEMCGDRYFRALQSLDVDTINAGHDGIAALAAAGALKAVVTTNFDQLIERALDKRGVNYAVAKDDVGYVKMLQRLAPSRERGPLPVLKIHGSVTDPKSMIDTLKQRKLGRSRNLQQCLDVLQSGYWVYLGFSAADLETDKSYLGLVAGAARSAGASLVRGDELRDDAPRPISTRCNFTTAALAQHGAVLLQCPISEGLQATPVSSRNRVY
jgi:hypothetical protein